MPAWTSDGGGTLAAADPAYQPKDDVLRAWADLADSIDRVDLALAIRDGLAPTPEDRLVQTRLLLLSGDAEAARAQLGREPGRPLPSSEQPFGLEDLLAAACDAALGDDAALGWLLSAASRLADSDRGWYCAYLVAAAASARGDLRLADQAWTVLVRRYGVRTELTVPAAVIAELSIRDAVEGELVLRTLGSCASALESLVHRVEVDPQPTLEAASQLVKRGDTPGARLLIDVVSRRNPPVRSLQDGLAALEPRAAIRRYRLKAWALVVLALCVVPLGILGFILIKIGTRLFRQRVLVPGLKSADSHTWRGLRWIRFNAGRARVEVGGGQVTGWEAFLLIIGGVIGAGLGWVLAAWVANWFGISEIGTSLPLVLIWLSSIIAVPTFLVLADRIVRAHLSQMGRRRAAAAESRRQREAAVRCSCWEATMKADEAAEAYLTRHLAELPSGHRLTQLPTTLSGLARARLCPDTGAAWLAVTGNEGTGLILLRGPVPSPRTAESTTDNGFYL